MFQVNKNTLANSTSESRPKENVQEGGAKIDITVEAESQADHVHKVAEHQVKMKQIHTSLCFFKLQRAICILTFFTGSWRRQS